MKTGPDGISPQQLKDVQKEVTIMGEMSHDNIVKIHSVGRGPLDLDDGSEPEEVLFIIMNYAKEGELFDWISKSGKFSESVARYFLKQILSALSYMQHTAGVCHRDLKPENILMDENFNLLLADWGFATPLTGQSNTGKLHSYKGTLGFMSPELHSHKSYSGKEADLFAVGVILFMMVTQCQPFDEAKVTDKYYRLIAGNRPSQFWRIFDRVVSLSDDLKDLLVGMMQLDPSARFTLDEVLTHPWMQGPVPAYAEIHKEFVLRKQEINKGESTTSSSVYGHH